MSTQGLENLIPGLKEAIEHENSAWDAAWLGLNESICGIEVMPYTPRHDLILGPTGACSPFFTGEWRDNPKEIAIEVQRFMWVVSPHYFATTSGAIGRWEARNRRRKFLRQVGKVDALDLIAGINKYIEQAFSDAPGGSGGKSVSFYSWLPSLIDVFGAEYGWGREYVANMPFKQIFQLCKVIQRRKQPDCHLFKPSDRIISQWLLERNKKPEAN